MAALLITEYADLTPGSDGSILPIACEPSIATQSVTYTTSTQSAALDGKTRFVRLMADATCHIAVGANPTATATSTKLQADTDYFFGLGGMGSLKIAAYDGTS